VKLLLLFSRFQGSMHIPTIAATYPPRRMLMNRGNRAVRSQPAEILFAEMFVPICTSVLIPWRRLKM